MAQHRFSEARYSVRTSDYPGRSVTYCEPELTVEWDTAAIDSKHLKIDLPPDSEITINLGLKRFVDNPSYSHPL